MLMRAASQDAAAAAAMFMLPSMLLLHFSLLYFRADILMAFDIAARHCLAMMLPLMRRCHTLFRYDYAPLRV